MLGGGGERGGGCHITVQCRYLTTKLEIERKNGEGGEGGGGGGGEVTSLFSVDI